MRDNDKPSSPICVLGFGRSGTSLTMRVLNLLGVYVGPAEDLMLAHDTDNPRGYWEPQWMADLNDEILALLGTTWWQPLRAAPGWEGTPDLAPLRERARSLLEEKFGAAALWGWKEPRTTLTLPFWRVLTPNARYVICLRNPVDAIASIRRRPEPDLPAGEWGDLWLEYTARALQETQDSHRLIVFYEDFFLEPQLQIARIASFLGVQPPRDDLLDSSPLLREAIEQSLRHHATPLLDLAAANDIVPSTRLLFLALRAAESLRRGQPQASSDNALVADAIERAAPELWQERLAAASVQPLSGAAGPGW
jgi:hypothetical protein